MPRFSTSVLILALFCTSLVSLGLFVSSAEAATPNGRYGWYTPHGEVVGDDASCGAGMNRMELSLRERGTGNPVVVRSALFMTQTSAGSLVASAEGTGPTVGTICYDPGIHTLGISIDGGTNYYNFESAIVATSSSIIPRGKHVRSIVWLTPVGTAPVEYTQQSPIGGITAINPSYRLSLNYFPNTYGATGLSQGTLFVNSWNTSTNQVQRAGGLRRELPLSGGIGTAEFPVVETLSDGHYTWAFYANLNGSHNPGFGASELNELKSGLAWFGSPFTLDRTGPNMPSPSHSPATPGPSDMVTFTSNAATDAHAGFASIQLYVNDVLRSTCAYTGQTSRTCTPAALGPFSNGTVVNYFFVGRDRAGNVATSSTNSFTVFVSTLPDLTVANRGPLSGTNFELNTTNFFYATVTNSMTASFNGTNTIVRLQIDYDSNNVNSPNVNLILNGGLPINPLGPGESIDISGAVANMPSGRHRYRFYVDTRSLLDESNEGNNYSGWVTYYVGYAPGTGVAATPYVCDQITVTWSAIAGAASYTIMDNGIPIATTSASAGTSYAHRNLVPDSSHLYQVRANFSGGGSTAYSSGVSATAPAACTPDVPDLIAVNRTPLSGTSFDPGTTIYFYGTTTNSSQAVIADGGTALLDVDRDSAGAVEYTVNAFGGTTLGGFAPGESKNLTASLSSIPAGVHRYRFRVDTANLVPESNDTNNVANWTTFYIRPYAPGSLSATPNDCGTRSIYVAWSAAAGASSYTVMDNGTPIATTTNRYYTHSNLIEGSAHSYQVRANNVGGNSAYSAMVPTTAPFSCTSFSGTGANLAPPIVDVSVSTTTIFTGQTVDVSWNTELGGEPESCSRVGPFNPSVNWPSGTETVTLSTPGTITFAIRCVNNGGIDEDIDSVNVTALPSSEVPELTVEPLVVRAGNFVRLEWDTKNERLGGEGVCALRRGSMSGPLVVPSLDNGTGDMLTGYVDIEITAQTTFYLVCTEYTTTATVNIRPMLIET